jgi:hypothetical protein
MKRTHEIFSFGLLVLAVALFCAAAPAHAQQSRDLKIISARAGGINFTSGSVKFKRRASDNWLQLSANDDLSSGDTVTTGANGLVEVLLNPGSYLRVAENSEFELVDNSLDSLHVKLVRGSAVVEATGYDKDELVLVIQTPHTNVSVMRTGLYRFNVLASNSTEVVVRKGRAQVGAQKELLKGDTVARVGGASSVVELAKLDKKQRDALDLWSRERADALAKANQSLWRRNEANDRINMALVSFGFNSEWPTRVGTRGIWVYSAIAKSYIFLPFYGGLSSPYGRGYHSHLGWIPGGRYCNTCPTQGMPAIVTRPNPNDAINPAPIVGNNPNPGPNPVPTERRADPFPRDAGRPVLDRPQRDLPSPGRHGNHQPIDQ